MKKLLAILLFCFFAISNINTAFTNADRWQWLYSDDKKELFFDTQSFAKTGQTTYSAWIKTQMTEQYGKIYAKKVNLSSPISHILELYEFNFEKKQIRILQIVIYNHNGEVLDSFTSNHETWSAIIPQSIGEAPLQVTNDYYIKHITTNYY